MKRRAAKALSPQPSALSFGLQPCPGLRAGIFTDCRGRPHDLAQEKPISPKEATRDARLPDSPRAILALLRSGQLYPFRRENARVLRIYPCAIADYWDRLTLPKLVRTA